MLTQCVHPFGTVRKNLSNSSGNPQVAFTICRPGCWRFRRQTELAVFEQISPLAVPLLNGEIP
ncbi:MAG: hypothetical protein KDA86_28410, partial [Planctomycetaceae bacterium]|nr:hypothetical protein [Planctomycetaceae bacterium]